jgi:hypothetical protein
MAKENLRDSVQHKKSIEPKFKVGDYVSYTAGDINKEKWYGVVERITLSHNGKEYLYGLNSFNTNYRKWDDNNELFEPQLHLVTEETYFGKKKEWDDNHQISAQLNHWANVGKLVNVPAWGSQVYEIMELQKDGHIKLRSMADSKIMYANSINNLEEFKAQKEVGITSEEMGTFAGQVDKETMHKAFIPNLPVKVGGYTDEEIKAHREKFVAPTQFKGIHHDYKNNYELNKAIEAFLAEKGMSNNHQDYTSDEKLFIRKYSGYGGLDKYGTTGKGGLFEYYTPKEVIEKMWALAYKYGYNNGSVLEPSIATGEFLQFAKPEIRQVGFEINEFSAIICKVLYPTAEIKFQPFEQHFIKNNWTVKGNVEHFEKFDLAIGNPPYGDFSIVQSRYMSGMGEKDYTKAKNYVEYFIRRSMDLLNPNGLLIFIVGAQIKNGGTLFLDSGSSPVKEWLSENSTLLDAYRLPDSIFERTGVTTDIIVIQKNK